MGFVSGISRAAQIAYAIESRFPRQAGTVLRQTIAAGTDIVKFRGSDLARKLA